MLLYICFVDPFNTPNVELKEDAQCIVSDDGSVVINVGSDTIRLGTLDAFYPSLPAKGEWTFCTADRRLAEAVQHALEAGSFCGAVSDSKMKSQIVKAFEIGRYVGCDVRTDCRRLAHGPLHLHR